MRRIAITGASGIIGTTLQRQFPEIEFFCFDGDIRNPEAVQRFCLSAVSCEAIIHLAALVPKQAVDRNPLAALDINVRGTLNILDCLRDLGDSAPFLLFASSSHVYASSVNSVCESDELLPFTFYGLTKLQAEEWCRAYARDFNLRICIARIFSFTDSRQSNLFFIPAMFNKVMNARQGALLEIGGVNGKRDFLTAEQVATAIVHLCTKGVVGNVNIGSGVGTPLVDVVNKIVSLCNRQDLTISFVDDQPDYHVANVELLSSYGLALPPLVDDVLVEMATRIENGHY